MAQQGIMKGDALQKLGIAGFSLGIVQTFNGRESTFNLFMILNPLTMLWFLVIGIWVARKARKEENQ